MNRQNRSAVQTWQKRQQILFCQGHTALCCGCMRVCTMQENGTSRARLYRPVIIAKRDDQIIQPVFAPQRFMPVSRRQHHRPVIENTGRIIYPAHLRAQRPAGQQAVLSYLVFICPVGPVIQTPQRPAAHRCGAVPFCFLICRNQPGSADKTGKMRPLSGQLPA